MFMFSIFKNIIEKFSLKFTINRTNSPSSKTSTTVIDKSRKTINFTNQSLSYPDVKEIVNDLLNQKLIFVILFY